MQAENLIAHREEIYSRPKKTWFVTEKEKRLVAKASKVISNLHTYIYILLFLASQFSPKGNCLSVLIHKLVHKWVGHLFRLLTMAFTLPIWNHLGHSQFHLISRAWNFTHINSIVSFIVSSFLL